LAARGIGSWYSLKACIIAVGLRCVTRSPSRVLGGSRRSFVNGIALAGERPESGNACGPRLRLGSPWSAAGRRRGLCAVASMEEAYMANERDPLRDRNPMRSDEEVDRTNEEDLIGQADEEDYEDIEEMEDDEDLEA
jgi:hypothetical protein